MAKRASDPAPPFADHGELADYLTAHSYCPEMDTTLRRVWATISIWWAALAFTGEPLR